MTLRDLREMDLTLTSAVEIFCAAEAMNNKLKAMLLGSSGPGENLDVAEGQRPTSWPSESVHKPAWRR